MSDVAGAGFQLSVLAGVLGGPAASAPGWLGKDAGAAAVQVGAVATLARQAADGVLAAMHRLSAHADCLDEARAQVLALEREQQDDVAATWARLNRVENPQLAVMTAAPAWVGPVEELRSSEASRRRRHAALLERVADDATATARVLADSCRAVGGRGAPGDFARVLAHVAARLPGWGAEELTARGRAFADLFRQPLTTAELESRARQAAPLAGSVAFANALLAGLGVRGMREALALVGDGEFGPDSPLASLLAHALGTATTGDHGRVDDVLDAEYVDALDPDLGSDRIVLGMAVVLGAAAAGRGVLPPALVLRWGRQIIGRELVQGAQAMDRVNPEYVDVPPIDAVPLVVDLLGAGGDRETAADLLGDREVWSLLLARTWDDEGLGLARLVRVATWEAGPGGGTAARAGLEALGTGLADGDPTDWTVDRDTAAAIARNLAVGVIRQTDAVTSLLATASAGPVSARDGDALRGLGYLTVDRTAAALVDGGLTAWADDQRLDLDGTSPAAPLSTVAVPAAYLAVQEYGQRLAYALHGYEMKAAAEHRALVWNLTAGLLTYVPGPLGLGWGVLEPVVASVAGTDGRWDNGPDTGRTWDRDDAAGAGRARAPELGRRSMDETEAVAEIVRQSRATFDRVSRTLGDPKPPQSPTVLDVAADAALSQVGGGGGVGGRKRPGQR